MNTKNSKRIRFIINLIYFCLALLFYLDAFTSFDIKNESLKLICYFGTFILIPFVLFYNFICIQSVYSKIISFIIPVMSIILIVVVGPLVFMFSLSSWKTQTIIYEHTHFNFKKIEFQMRDLGALGYSSRRVEVLYLTPYFMITKPIDKNIEDKIEWRRVDKEINELGIQ